MEFRSYYLECQYDRHNSFYNKAIVIVEGNRIRLKSYNTIVAQIIGNKCIVYGTYSSTTLRHIKEFLKQNGYKAESKGQIERDYMNL